MDLMQEIKLPPVNTFTGTIEPELAKKSRDFLQNVRPKLTAEAKRVKRPRLSFEERAKSASQPVAKRLFEIIAKKRTNLCVAVDVTSAEKLLQLADQLGPHVCAIKTHVDILEDFNFEKVCGEGSVPCGILENTGSFRRTDICLSREIPRQTYH